MNITGLKLASAIFLGSATVAMADVGMVNCDGIVISLAETIATAGQEQASSMAEWEGNVCDAAKQLPLDDYEGPTPVDILIEPYGIATKIVVFASE